MAPLAERALYLAPWIVLLGPWGATGCVWVISREVLESSTRIESLSKVWYIFIACLSTCVYTVIYVPGPRPGRTPPMVSPPRRIYLVSCFLFFCRVVSQVTLLVAFSVFVRFWGSQGVCVVVAIFGDILKNHILFVKN